VGEPQTFDGIPWRSGSGDAGWAVAGHAGSLLVSFLAPLAVLLVRGRRSGLDRQHGFESLNFQLTLLIGYLLGLLLVILVIGLVLLLALWIANVVFLVQASLAARRGEPYRYPVSIRFFG
jgi:uncharacterized Tic20 family protein